MWNSNLVLSTSFLMLAELADSPLCTSFLVPEDRVSSCRLSREYAVGSWLLFRTSFVALDETFLGFATAEPSSVSAFLRSLGSDTLLSILKENGCRKTSRNS